MLKQGNIGSGVFRAVLGLLSLILVSSASGNNVKERVDSLNGAAYAWRYKDVARSLALANRAHKLSGSYGDGHCEALNHIVYVCYHQMDFDRAERLALQVRRQADNQIEALVADVMLMKICQRTSRNRMFYVYRNSAERRIQRIEEERNLLTERERRRLLFAETEFRIVSSTYYYYLKQLPRALAEIDAVEAMDNLREDTAQWLYYNYMKGSGGLCEGRNADEVALREFDYLFKSFTLSKVAGYLYFEGNNLQSLASLLSREDFFALIRRNRPDGLRYLRNLCREEGLPEAEDSLYLSGWLARRALEKFRRYGDLYQVACAYRTAGELLLAEERYADALDNFVRALGYVNHHHRRYYPSDSLRALRPYAETDGQSVEMQWMNDGDVRTVPEWIAGIREQMSVAYSALGDKRKSDYNRNVYLDILEQTRQDRELENRCEELNAGSRTLSLLLALVFASMLLLFAACVYLYRLGRRRGRRQVALLQHVLESCRRLTSAGGCYEDGQAWTREERQAIDRLLRPYNEWAEENRHVLQDLGDKRQLASEQRAVSECRIAGNKRKNVENRAKLSLVHAIVPFIDRILGEAERLRRNDGKRQERLVYVKELADRIRVYNDMLTDWIQLRQGELSLHVETFAMQEVFDIVKKGYRVFEQAGLTLEVVPTDILVKADKALTLFMVNTLADNARKFTPPGGKVTLEASATEACVEVRVTDTGCGLTPEEVDRILTSKVYDASDIGTCDEFARSRKGHGFGLMNCKGIIEKYRKTSQLFSVCSFFVTSRVGQGACFGFRLPRGARKSLFALLLLWNCGLCGARAGETFVPDDGGEQYAALLQRARMYNDSLYVSNLEGAYERALACSDSVFRCLNACYRLAHPGGSDFLRREAGDAADVPPEVRWWTDGWEEMDYSLLLGWRNETAVAALATHDWMLYRYNNDVYTQLYKQVSQDQTLGAYCKVMESSRNSKRVGIILLVCLAAVGVLVFYIFYFRRTLLFRMNLAQLLATNRRLLECFCADGDMEHRVAELLQTVWEGLNEIHTVEGMRLELYDENGGEPVCFAVGHVGDGDARVRVYPLQAEEASGRTHRFGTLLIHVPDGSAGEPECLLDEMMVSYLSALLYGGMVRRRQERDELEQAEDERQRALYEENQLHVQNQILDNCLSTIKHEAMYYPGRISQMADRMAGADDEKNDIPALAEELNEWVVYYRTLYTLLARQAEHQLARVNFRRRPCRIDGLLNGIRNRASACLARGAEAGSLSIANASETHAVTGDADLLAFLLESILSAMAEDCRRAAVAPVLVLRVEDEGRFVRFTWLCEAVGHTDAELHDLFMPDGGHIPYLISKQIIREHDTFTNHCGCRINAEALPGGGYCIWFTLPKSKEHETF